MLKTAVIGVGYLGSFHAKKFAAFALATRKDVDHGITFETTPISVLNLMAGVNAVYLTHLFKVII